MKRVFFGALLISSGALYASPVLDDLTELLNTPVVSSSLWREFQSDAPATVLVITGEEIRKRGYRDLSEIYNDLPGMQLSRTYADIQFKNYWRGMRKTIGDPFLLLVDGQEVNDLYYNEGEIIASLPVTNIDRIEVVYGPASVVYGANAFVGVVNVITRTPTEDMSLVSWSTGDLDRDTLDFTVTRHFGDEAVQITGRYDYRLVDYRNNRHYEWLNAHYLTDRRLWGGFLDDLALAGQNNSRNLSKALDAQYRRGEWQFRSQYFELTSGGGLAYAFDKAQPHYVWREWQWLNTVERSQQLSERLKHTMRLRQTATGVWKDGYFVLGFNETANVPGGEQRVIQGSVWQNKNMSWLVQSDWHYDLSTAQTIAAGLKIQYKDLHKAGRNIFGPALPPSDVDLLTYPFPTPASSDPVPRNRIKTWDYSIYGLWRVELVNDESNQQWLHLGVRYDDNSEYGGATSFRGGYVYRAGPWSLKLLYGEAYQPPTPRLLYGGWTGAGSDPTLDPEVGRTAEVSVSYLGRQWVAHWSLFDMQTRDTIVNFIGGAGNLGKRTIHGSDLSAKRLWRDDAGRSWQLWGSYSYLDVEETKPNDQAIPFSEEVGDIAPHQFHVGIEVSRDNHWSLSLRGRWYAARDTVSTNPVGQVDSYHTWDANFRYRPPTFRSLTLFISVNNLFDTLYFHPGVRDAGAGTTPGFFDANGVWHGSQSFYNSLLPQPARTWMAGFEYHW